uniref:G-protein coupled receptors family 1 profile domain-containing protein n=1 Tax=Pyxicephalus adspersus TaxID=30357 RepID=A0AAV3A6V0_PYXAD|nr:TPA: hypothetical protein GDO54_015037 [Pyxicephalus adspersus]
MESNTSLEKLHILPFFIKVDNKLFIFNIVFFFLIYLTGILENIVIIVVICLNLHLHTPMYLFICNLAIIDICYTSLIVPKLLYILLSGNTIISFTECYIQLYFFFQTATIEDMVIFIMAYDRYVAICHPLKYHQILNRKKCILITMAIWVGGCVNSSLFTSSISKMFFCSSINIHQLFCDAKALIKISCGGTEMFYIILYTECVVTGLWPVLCGLMSYVKIIRVIVHIKSNDGRRKAFSTCSSHLIVMIIYYGSSVSVYMTPPSDRYKVLEQIFTFFYSTVVPLLNPLIYSLRNKEVKNSLRKLLK